MVYYSPKNRLLERERNQLLLELCQALAIVKDFDQAAQLLIDLFSEKEVEMIAKRLKIAKLLIQGLTYEEIASKLKVAPGTIARVNAWLNESGEGFRMVIKKGKPVEIPDWAPKKQGGGMWAQLKRNYPQYFWPDLVLEEIVRTANNRQRERLLNVVNTIKDSGKYKSEVYKKLDKLIRRGGEYRIEKFNSLE